MSAAFLRSLRLLLSYRLFGPSFWRLAPIVVLHVLHLTNVYRLKFRTTERRRENHDLTLGLFNGRESEQTVRSSSSQESVAAERDRKGRSVEAEAAAKPAARGGVRDLLDGVGGERSRRTRLRRTATAAEGISGR